MVHDDGSVGEANDWKERAKKWRRKQCNEHEKMSLFTIGKSRSASIVNRKHNFTSLHFRWMRILYAMELNGLIFSIHSTLHAITIGLIIIVMFVYMLFFKKGVAFKNYMPQTKCKIHNLVLDCRCCCCSSLFFSFAPRLFRPATSCNLLLSVHSNAIHWAF